MKKDRHDYKIVVIFLDICFKNMCKQNKTDSDSYTGGIKNE